MLGLHGMVQFVTLVTLLVVIGLFSQQQSFSPPTLILLQISFPINPFPADTSALCLFPLSQVACHEFHGAFFAPIVALIILLVAFPGACPASLFLAYFLRLMTSCPLFPSTHLTLHLYPLACPQEKFLKSTPSKASESVILQNRIKAAAITDLCVEK